MAAHTKEQFHNFMSQLSETNATLSSYSDFKKISANVSEIEISLNTLNYLLGKEDLEKAVNELWQRDPKVFDIMDILIATRKRDDKKYINDNGQIKKIHSLLSSVDGVMEFLKDTGLADVFKKKEIKNLVDYVFGVETGLDTHARKNRSGDITEEYVANIFSKNGIKHTEQVSSKDYPQIAKVLGADQKIFDFIVKTEARTFLIEVNFYSTGGSKLNEVAQSYTDIAPKVNTVNGFEFVWITDGKGWDSAKNKLEEAFMAIPRVYNLTTIHEFIKEIK